MPIYLWVLIVNYILGVAFCAYMDVKSGPPEGIDKLVEYTVLAFLVPLILLCAGIVIFFARTGVILGHLLRQKL